MQIMNRSTVSTTTIFLILSSPYDCICLTSLKITSTQGRLYVPSITSSVNLLSSASFLDMDRVLSFRYRSWTWTESYSFEQATSRVLEIPLPLPQHTGTTTKFPTPNVTRRVSVQWTWTTRSPTPVQGTTRPSIPLPLH